MRKRSKYRPKPRFQNPAAYVVESHMLLVDYDSTYITTWKIKNHAAMTAVTRGEAKRDDIDTLMAAHNLSEGAMHTLGATAVPDIKNTLIRSQVALGELAMRGNQTGRITVRAPEMQALNDLLALHDNLLEVMTVQQFERALAYAKREIQAKRCVSVKGVPA